MSLYNQCYQKSLPLKSRFAEGERDSNAGLGGAPSICGGPAFKLSCFSTASVFHDTDFKQLNSDILIVFYQLSKGIMGRTCGLVPFRTNSRIWLKFCIFQH